MLRIHAAESGQAKNGLLPGVMPVLLSNEFDTNDLHALSAKAQAAFEATAEGAFVSKAAVEATGLTAKECAGAYVLEWRRMYEGAIYPGQPPEKRKEALRLAAGNNVIPRRAAIWRALQALLESDNTHTGRLQAGSRSSVEGRLRTIMVHSKLEIRAELADRPVLCLDATMSPQIVRYFLPRLNVLAEVNPITPYMDVCQVLGGWGKTSIISNHKAKDDENRRREALVALLSDFAALNSGGDGVVITYQAIEAEFQRPGLRVAHFNAIAGLDEYKGVRSLFVIGRPLPDVRELHQTALELTGRPITLEIGQIETRGALMEDGSGLGISVRVYADEDLEALRMAITEREIVQALGRGRGVNRDAACPLTAFVFADVALPMPITRLVRWADIRPDVVAQMYARNGVLWSAVDASRAYPDILPTADAARKAIRRAEDRGISRTIPYESIIHRGLSGKSSLAVTYRPSGRGQQNRTATVTAEQVAGFRRWLEGLIGPLVHFSIPLPANTPSAQEQSTEAPVESNPLEPIEPVQPEGYGDLLPPVRVSYAQKLVLRARLQGRPADQPAWDAVPPEWFDVEGERLDVDSIYPRRPFATQPDDTLRIEYRQSGDGQGGMRVFLSLAAFEGDGGVVSDVSSVDMPPSASAWPATAQASSTPQAVYMAVPRFDRGRALAARARGG